MPYNTNKQTITHVFLINLLVLPNATFYYIETINLSEF